MVTIVDDNFIPHTVLVHRLVAIAFLEIPEELKNSNKKIQVNHKTGDKNDNSVNNLEWCDQSYNMKEAYRLGLRHYVPYKVTDEYREKMRKLSSKPAPGKEVEMINKSTGEVIETFSSAVEAVKKHPELNLSDSSIRDAANGRRGIKTYKGFIWRFTGKITNGTNCRKFNPEKRKKIKR